jgi:hypothetical protein
MKVDYIYELCHLQHEYSVPMKKIGKLLLGYRFKEFHLMSCNNYFRFKMMFSFSKY